MSIQSNPPRPHGIHSTKINFWHSFKSKQQQTIASQKQRKDAAMSEKQGPQMEHAKRFTEDPVGKVERKGKARSSEVKNPQSYERFTDNRGITVVPKPKQEPDSKGKTRK